MNDLVSTALLMGDLKYNDNPDKITYVLGYGHLKTFLDDYFAHLALTDIDLSNHFNRRLKVPKALLKGKISIKDYDDVKIVHDHFGVVLIGKGTKKRRKKFLFHVDDVERYSNTYLISILLHINNCQKKQE
ncbi:unnamed protein product [Lactuca virosa]|uniref:Uncharacterized protein n=1 Tax=Lactuca virosa TaxID=75947 RepID=A0AAU9LT03_9ASTR|nr:unnamed protein product [Lactuca virosa]